MIFHSFAVVLIHREPVVSPVNENFRICGIFPRIISAVYSERYNRTLFCKNGYCALITEKLYAHRAVINAIIENIGISALGYPCVCARKKCFFVPRFSNRCDNKLRTEIIFVFAFVCFRTIWVFIIHRFANCPAVRARSVIHCIEIRQQPVAKPHKFRSNGFNALWVLPRLLAHKLVWGWMKAHYRWKNTKLNPSEIQLIVLFAEAVTAYVMAPPCITDIGCGWGKVRLKIKRSPPLVSISRKAERIAVRACARKPWKYERTPLAVSCNIHWMIVVECPKRVKSRNVGLVALLPVNPPKVNAHVLKRLVDYLEICLDIFFVGYVKLVLLFILWVVTHKSCKLIITVLKRAYSGCRMKIERYLEILVLKPWQEALRVRKKIGVPAVARPAAVGHHIKEFLLNCLTVRIFCGFFSEFFLNVNPMPIHIDSSHRNRNFSVNKPLHKSDVFVLRVRLISRPPVSESKPRNKRSRARKLKKITDCVYIIVSVGKEIYIAFLMSPRNNLTVRGNYKRIAVAKPCNAVTGYNSVSDFYTSARTVKGSACAFKITGIIFGYMP